MGIKIGPNLKGTSVIDNKLFILLDAADLNSHSGTFEDTWEDTSGNDRHCYRLSTPSTTAASGTSGNPDEDTPRFTRDGLEFYGLNTNSKFQFGSISGTGTRHSISNTTSGITVLAIMKTTSTDSTVTYAGNAALNILGDTTSSVNFGFGVTGGKAKVCFYSSSGWVCHESNATVNDGNWHQIGFAMGTGNPCVVKIYVDGQLDKTISSSGNSSGIGFNSVGLGYAGDMFIGTLRNLMVFEEELSTSVINNNWSVQKTFTGGRGPYSGSQGNIPSKGGRFFAEFKYRQIINYAYVGCGYKSSSPWKNVHKTVVSTDQTTNLGTLMQYAAAYTSGGCSLNIFYMWATSNSWPGTSTQTAAVNMFTESSYTLTNAMNLIQSRNDCGTMFHEHNYAWITGGGNSSVDKFNFWTETMASSTFSGGIAGDAQGGVATHSDQYVGYFGDDNENSKLAFLTDTITTATSNSFFFHGQQKGISSKLRKGYAGNEGSYNGGYNLRRWHYPTDASMGTVTKPQPNCGEENHTMGQDHQYMLGNYDGVQNNENWKFYYATDTGTANVNGLSPTAQAGQSSGHCAWRE